MTERDWSTDIRAWIDEETTHIDVVASWESLCQTYDMMRLTDKLTDAERLEEFKCIVQQMNSFLTKIRTKLLSCKNHEAMIEMLSKSCTTSGMDLTTRKSLVYQKLRQQWMITMMSKIRQMMTAEQEDMEDQDGWNH